MCGRYMNARRCRVAPARREGAYVKDLAGFDQCGPTFQFFMSELNRFNKLAEAGTSTFTDKIEDLIIQLAEETKAAKAAKAAEAAKASHEGDSVVETQALVGTDVCVKEKNVVSRMRSASILSQTRKNTLNIPCLLWFIRQKNV